MGLRKDIWTLYPFLAHRLRAIRPPEAKPWSTVLRDEDVGEVKLTGALRERPDATDLVIVIHGLGGRIDSYYCLRGALAADEFGCSSLALALRGADRKGDDFYNIALREDIAAAVASPELAHYERIYVLGYSMGGYVTMHYARSPSDPRVKAVAAVCTPLDLLAAQKYIDSPRPWFYRQHVLNGLKSIYAACAASGKHPVPSDPALVARVRTMYEWDRLAIAPRYGYDSPEHYYKELSIIPHLKSLATPTLLVAGESDPIVPPPTIRPFLDRALSPDGAFGIRWVHRGGHVAFPRSLDLGYGPIPGLEPQIFQWFSAHR